MKIVIADDHPLYLDAHAEHIARVFPESVIKTTFGVHGLMEILDDVQPVDLLIVDFSMPGMNGVASVRDIVTAARGAPVAVISGVAVPREIIACVDVGAKGVLPKTLDRRVFDAALRLMAAGQIYVPAEAVPFWGKSETSPGPDFTPRELIVIEAFVEGKSNKEIARLLNLREVTIKGEVSRIFDKLGAKNRAHAVALVFDRGILPPR
jgi:DNA-binding NarL/FixJ family response regulator